jgi:CheY-like chemotaxis protein
MAKILCIDDFTQYAEMMALYIEREGGHETAVEIVPFDLERIEKFKPDLIVLSIVRKMEHVREPITNFYSQVDGSKAFRELSTNPATAGYPLLIASLAVLESEVPKDLTYMGFIEIPSKFDNLLMIVDHILEARGQDIIPE